MLGDWIGSGLRAGVRDGEKEIIGVVDGGFQEAIGRGWIQVLVVVQLSYSSNLVSWGLIGRSSILIESLRTTRLLRKNKAVPVNGSRSTR
jgi:hypothetical protein